MTTSTQGMLRRWANSFFKAAVCWRKHAGSDRIDGNFMLMATVPYPTLPMPLLVEDHWQADNEVFCIQAFSP